LGTNQIFTDLAGHARTHPGCRLQWPSADDYQSGGGFLHHEQDNRSIMVVKGLPRPDGVGDWHEHGQRVSFLLEFDTGSESIGGVLVDKVIGYERVARHTVWRWPVLFVVPTVRREQNLHAELTTTEVVRDAVIATTARDLLDTTGQSPADPVWRLHGHHRPRVPLIQLPCTDEASADFDPTTPITGPTPTTVQPYDQDAA
jgi:hypothetical protein